MAAAAAHTYATGTVTYHSIAAAVAGAAHSGACCALSIHAEAVGAEELASDACTAYQVSVLPEHGRIGIADDALLSHNCSRL